MAGEDDGHEQGGRLRPRRLEPSTLSYLKEVSETLAAQQEDMEAEDAQLLLWNVLEELAPRAASATSDRHAGEIVEKFLPKMSDEQLRYFTSKFEGYYGHLWTNRYSSHVLQYLLSRASQVVQAELDGESASDAEEDDRMEGVPSMKELVLTMATEVREEWLDLMLDVSASHVFRSLLAVLAGRPLVAEKRGKKAKHSAVSFVDPKDKDGKVNMYTVPADFGTLFQEIVDKITSNAHSDVLQLIYDQNAGPVVASIVKLAPDDTRSEFVQFLLQWQSDNSKQIYYDFAGDPVASHMLEAISSNVNDELFTLIFRRCLQNRMTEFADHNIGNYVLQQALERVPSSNLAKDVLSELLPTLWTLLSTGKPGVVWRLAQLCARFNLDQEAFFRQLVAAVEKQESKKPAAAQKPFVQSLLSLQLASNASKRLQLNVMGAHIVSQLMKFQYAEYLETLFRGILDLNTTQLLALARDSMGSRCVVEPIWEMESEETQWVRKELFSKFKGNFGTLALDRFGAFSVMKCYEKVDLTDKSVIVEELMENENKVIGSHFGQLVANTVHLNEFKQNQDKWAGRYQKQGKLQDMFKDVFEDETATVPVMKKKKKSKKRKASEEASDPAQSSDVAMILDVLQQSDKKSNKKKKHKKDKKA